MFVAGQYGEPTKEGPSISSSASSEDRGQKRSDEHKKFPAVGGITLVAEGAARGLGHEEFGGRPERGPQDNGQTDRHPNSLHAINQQRLPATKNLGDLWVVDLTRAQTRTKRAHRLAIQPLLRTSLPPHLPQRRLHAAIMPPSIFLLFERSSGSPLACRHDQHCLSRIAHMVHDDLSQRDYRFPKGVALCPG